MAAGGAGQRENPSEGRSRTMSAREIWTANLGNHEVESLECCPEATGASSLWNKFLKCTKNPGHHKFIPIGQFGMGHLPASCRDKRLVSYIKLASRFTVRLVSKHTSTDRPDWYPCAYMKGTDLPRIASGNAWLTADIKEIPCPIPDCPYNKSQHNVYGYIRVLTNKHVVFDVKEAVRTNAQFFFDSPNHSNRTFVAQCIGLDHSSEDNDVAHLQCVTHDPQLCDELQNDLTQLKTVYSSIPPDVWQLCDDLCVVISHPHGMAKTVTVGKHCGFDEMGTRSHMYYYNSATCAGSSGAPVYYVSRKEKGGHPMWIPAVHSFHCHITQLNCGFK